MSMEMVFSLSNVFVEPFARLGPLQMVDVETLDPV
jgi:hypothetical protein